MTETYTKDDYLTPSKYAKLYNVSEETVKRAMKIAHIKHSSIKIGKGSTSREIVIMSHQRYNLRPEPDAHEKLMEIIQELQTKGK